MRHYNIPVFIPELACPNQCVYCNQKKITGKESFPGVSDMDQMIENHLSTIPAAERRIEIAFFGGNFTGLPFAFQQEYLEAARRWVGQGKADGIRLSTRPDYINDDTIRLLRSYDVSCIELGAQSLNDEVLRLSGRGHTAADVEKACGLILKSGIQLGLQMMIGLPGDSKALSLHTARRFAELGATQTRIYPTLVIRGTHLEHMMKTGQYKPLSMEETLDWCKELVVYFEAREVIILRLGLHPSEKLIEGGELVAGPFHPALKELVETAIWHDIFKKELKCKPEQRLRIFVHPAQLNTAIGHRAANRKYLMQRCAGVDYATDSQLKGRAFYVHYS
jgi:histone acetyltransferase (RNA polymerase elongator complex component)